MKQCFGRVPKSIRRARIPRFAGILFLTLAISCGLFANPSSADPVKLTGNCASLYEAFEQSGEYYRTFVLALGDDHHICSWSTSASEAVSKCIDQVYGQRLRKNGEVAICEEYAKSPVDGRLKIVWEDNRTQTANQTPPPSPKRMQREETARQFAEAESKRKKAAALKSAAAAQLYKWIVQAQNALRELSLYDGPDNGVMGVKTRRAYQTWLKANNYPPEKALSDALVADLRQQAQEKKARRVAKAKAEREENARKLAVASRKRTEAEAREVALHARLSTQADALMADVQGFLAADPGIKNILEVSIAFSDLEAALGEKQGRKSSGAVRKSMDQLKKLVTKNKTFRTFLAKKEEARKMAELSAFALSTAKLESFHKFLKVYLAKNLGSKSARRLIPVIKEIKATLGAPTKTNLDELSAKVASLINTTPNLRKAFANQKSAVEIAAARVASEVKRKSDADKKLKAEAAAKAKADRKRRLAMAKGKRRRALEKKHKHAIAVIIGNRNYSGSVPEVSFAHNDADAVRKFVVEKLGYRTGNVIDIRDASQARMMALFGTADTHKGELYSYVRPGKSDVTVFYSGHGVPGLEDRRGYLLPVDANPNLVEINGYPVDLLFSNLTKINAKSTTVYLDACFSGDSPKGMLVRAASGLTVTPTMPAKMPGMIVITAAKGNQFASWDEDAKLGLFTKHLLIALNGLADNEDYGNGDGRISLSEVRTYLDEEMTYQARRRYNREQQVSVQGDLGVVLVDNETR